MIHHKYLQHKEYVQFKLTGNSQSASAFIPHLQTKLRKFPTHLWPNPKSTLMSRQQVSFIWFTIRMLGRMLDEDFSIQVTEVFKSLSLSVLKAKLRNLIVPKVFEHQALAV
jgi:hypothetical protein